MKESDGPVFCCYCLKPITGKKKTVRYWQNHGVGFSGYAMVTATAHPRKCGLRWLEAMGSGLFGIGERR